MRNANSILELLCKYCSPHGLPKEVSEVPLDCRGHFENLCYKEVTSGGSGREQLGRVGNNFNLDNQGKHL